MIRAIAKWWARRSYIWELEVEAAKNETNAAIALRNAKEKLKLAVQLSVEADAIDKNIADQEKQLEAGFWECEDGHQKGGALSPDADGAARKCIECNQPAKFLKLSEMTGQEKYELEKQKKEAQTIAEEKRNLAKQEQENADAAVNAGKVLSARALDSRQFADKIRNI